MADVQVMYDSLQLDMLQQDNRNNWALVKVLRQWECWRRESGVPV